MPDLDELAESLKGHTVADRIADIERNILRLYAMILATQKAVLSQEDLSFYNETYEKLLTSLQLSPVSSNPPEADNQ